MSFLMQFAVIAPTVGSMILGAFLTGIVTMFVYEISKREWIALLACISTSMIAVLLNWLPWWIVFAILLLVVAFLYHDKSGRF